MIELPDGKMKSREGNVVDADTLADQLHHEAHALIDERYADRSDNDKKTQAEAIGMAAIKFYILLHDAKNNFIFDPKASISFDGETGPYIQYTYARCQSLIEKTRNLILPKVDLLQLTASNTQLHNLLLILARFPETQSKAVAEYAPHYIARYLLDLAKSFNSFYHHQTIINKTDTQQTANMIAIVRATQHIIGI
jgi:arginyl-tRNA synthetase